MKKELHVCLRCKHIFTRIDNMRRHQKYETGQHTTKNKNSCCRRPEKRLYSRENQEGVENGFLDLHKNVVFNQWPKEVKTDPDDQKKTSCQHGITSKSEKDIGCYELPSRGVKSDPDDQKKISIGPTISIKSITLLPIPEKKVITELSPKIIESEHDDQKKPPTKHLSIQKDALECSTTKNIKSESDDQKKNNPPVKMTTIRQTKDIVSMERMKRFLEMEPEDVTPRPKPKAKCTSAWSDIKKPVDTIRCVQCDVLYRRNVFLAHSKVCKGSKPAKKFRCALCTFTNSNFEQLKEHVRSEHHQ
ncbi:hypothetical protein JTB14_025849 [Gonioctena quinquepunctata]|nr:hypothetical protein JTB14_025849 [Gonioctena quinquepunctata]